MVLNDLKLRIWRRTLEYYEDLSFSHTSINTICLELFKHLNSASTQARVHRAIVDRIKYIGQSLYDQLFTLKVKELLHSCQSQELILKIESTLVQIPWELLHDGDNFLCHRFSIGRMVSTKQTIAPFAIRSPKKPQDRPNSLPRCPRTHQAPSPPQTVTWQPCWPESRGWTLKKSWPRSRD